MNAGFNSTGFNSGFYGMQLASQGMQRSAQQIASAGVRDAVSINSNPATTAAAGGVNITESLVSLKQNVHLFNASAKVVATSDQMIGSLLDVHA